MLRDNDSVIFLMMYHVCIMGHVITHCRLKLTACVKDGLFITSYLEIICIDVNLMIFSQLNRTLIVFESVACKE